MTDRKKEKQAAAVESQGSTDRVTVDDVMKMLEEDGIRDLQQFIKSELAHAKKASKAPQRASMLGPSVGKPSRRGPAQRPVEVPVLIDGVLYDPKDIHRFDGQILHFVAPVGERPLQAYTGDQWPTALRTFIQYQTVARALGWKSEGLAPPPIIYHSEFFSDSDFNGDYLWLDWQHEWPDLTQVYRGDFWNRQSWNDCISSVVVSQGVGFLVLCEDINLGGASLSVHVQIPDLTPYGWNDRTSSIVWW